MGIPTQREWLFWEADLAGIDLDRHAEYVLVRVLERGRLDDVRWLLRQYGVERVRALFRSKAHPELSTRTRQFWKTFLGEGEQPWPTLPAWRTNSSAPWID